MLTIDMAGLSERELEAIVVDRCSRYGKVSSIRVVRLPGAPHAVAFVRMATLPDLEQVVAHVGASKSRSTAIITLEPAQARATVSH